MDNVKFYQSYHIGYQLKAETIPFFSVGCSSEESNILGKRLSTIDKKFSYISLDGTGSMQGSCYRSGRIIYERSLSAFDDKPHKAIVGSKDLQRFHSWPEDVHSAELVHCSTLTDMDISGKKTPPTIVTESARILCSDDGLEKERFVLAKSARAEHRRDFNCTDEKKHAGIYKWVMQDNFAETVEALEYRVYTDDAVVNKKLAAQRISAEKHQNEQSPRDFISQKFDDWKFTALPEDGGSIKLGCGSLFGWTGAKQAAEITIQLDYKTENARTGVAWSIGRRQTMEDSHIASTFQVTVAGIEFPVQITGVFDGHGGSEFAEYMRDNIVNRVKFYLESFNQNGFSNAGIMSALKITMVDIDGRLMANTPSGIKDCEKDSTACPGTTASVAIIINHELWVANVGDSRALLTSENGDTQQVSRDIKPHDVIEKVIKRGGMVLSNRVMGMLATGTAIGDHNFASVSSRPKVTRYIADEFSGKLLIQVCDGITDVASSDEIGQVAAQYSRESEPPAKIAGKLVARAYAAGSSDNLTCMITHLGISI